MTKNNYRPIALASVVTKVAEIVIYNRISVYLDTCPNQFGFKRNHSTDQYIYLLKEIIDAYRVLNGSVFTCFFRCEQGILPSQSFHFAFTVVNMVTQQQCVATVISSDQCSEYGHKSHMCMPIYE